MRNLLSKLFLVLTTGLALAIHSITPAHAQIRVDSRMYTASGSCAHCNLSGRTLTGMTLKDSNFSGAQFNRANLSGGNFDRSNLSNTQFKRAFLARVEGQSVNMANASFQDATMTEAKFDDAILTNSDLQRADISRANFTHSNFADANLTSATAPNVNFEGSKFVNARFDHMNLRNAKLDGAKFFNVEFGNAVLIGATMVGADFSKADLSQVQGLQQTQLDLACGDSATRLPIGLSLAYCENMQESTHVAADHDKLSPQMARAAKRLDIAISNIESLLADSETNDPKLRRKLQRIHSEMMSSRRAIEN